MFRLFRKLTERRWPDLLVGPISIDPVTALITVPDTKYLAVKQKVQFEQAGQPNVEYEVAQVLSPTQIRIQELDGKFNKFITLPAAYNGGNLRLNKPERNQLQAEIITRATYQEEPAVAVRTLGVSHLGTPLTTPDGQLESIEPVARFIYGPSFEVLFIREFSPDAQVGDYCRQTAFLYGPSLEVLKITTSNDMVQAGDLI